MKIGIVGLGVVGTAVSSGLRALGHTIKEHDIRFKTTINDLFNTEVCFICVPTPSKENGECNVSIVESVVEQMNSMEYKGIVAIKSTVVPGTTENLRNKYKNLEICFVPEFLRERCAVADFTDNHDLCVVGTNNKAVFEKIKKCHGRYPETFVQVSPTESEFVKYFNNVYNSMLIIFANSFYETCKSLDANYTNIKDAAVKRSHINDKYLDCNENLRGFGGVCLPKDTRALDALVKEKKLDIDFFKAILKENSKYRITTYSGMREE
jgi:UDPglucose 6-dehydrogenase